MVILIRNDDRYQRFPLNFIYRVINAVVHTFFHALRLDTDAFIMIHDRARTRIKCVQLALRVARCRILVAAPVIQHLRDMADLLRLLRTTENEVIILRSVVFLTEAAHLRCQIVADYKQMADIVDAAEQIDIEIRLKMRIKQSAAVHIQLILIRIEAVTSRMFL